MEDVQGSTEHRPGRASRIYLFAVLLGGGLSLWAGWKLTAVPPAFWPVVVCALVAAAAAPFSIPVPLVGNISLSFAWILTTLMLFGTPAAAIAAAAGGLAGGLSAGRWWRPWFRLPLTIGGALMVAVAGGLLFQLANGHPGAVNVAREWPAALVVALTFLLGGAALSAGFTVVTRKGLFSPHWHRALRHAWPNFVAATPMGILLALGVHRFGLKSLPFSLIPLYILHFSLKIYSDAVRQRRRHLEEIADLYLSVIEALALAIDAKDRTTERQLRRVQAFAMEMGRLMGLPKNDLEALRAGAVLHDIGKLAVPEYILCKPGRLTPDEFDKMAIHPRIGAEILERVHFPYPIASVVRSHHEKFDGTGYPDKLAGEQIPLAARILSVVDSFDALTSERPYRRPLSPKEALAQIREESGSSFDPRVVDCLIANVERIEKMFASSGRSAEGRPAGQVGALPCATTTSATGNDAPSAANLLSVSIMENISSAHRESYDLYEIAQGMGGSLKLEESLSGISEKIARLIPHRCLIVYLYDKDRRVLRARFVHGPGSEIMARYEIPIGERTSGWAAQHGLPITSNAPPEPLRRKSPPPDLDELIAAGTIEPLESAVAAPLLDGDELLGVLALYDLPDRPFAQDSLRMISIVARHIGSGVKNALLYEETQENALTDPLTRLPNARYLFGSFEQEINRATTQQDPLSIIVLDVDHFKEVNDRFGHPAGDRILRGVARAIRSQMRSCDTCVRYAGDEFIITVPGVGSDEIEGVQKRIARAIAKHKFAVARNKALKVTVSMGAASFPGEGKTIESLIAVADAQMYARKFAGRDHPVGPETYQRFALRRHQPLN